VKKIDFDLYARKPKIEKVPDEFEEYDDAQQLDDAIALEKIAEQFKKRIESGETSDALSDYARYAQTHRTAQNLFAPYTAFPYRTPEGKPFSRAPDIQSDMPMTDTEKDAARENLRKYMLELKMGYQLGVKPEDQ